MSVSEDVKNIMAEQDYLSDDRDILTDLLTEERACVTTLNTNFTALNTKHQLLKKCQQADHERTLLFNAFMHSAGEDQRSQKLSDSSLLDNGSESTWDNWLEKMRAKLSVNRDHFSEEADWMRYMLSRLSERAAQYTESRSLYEPAVIDSYQTADDILKNLKEIYKDSDKSRNYWQVYIDLLQGFKQFSDFYVEFCHLSTFLEYGETQCMDNLWDKISPCLQVSLSSQMVQPDSLLTMKAYLIHLDNEQRAAKAAKNWKDANTTAALMKKVKPFKHITFRSSQPIVKSSMPSGAVNKRPFTDPQHQADE